MKQLIIKILMYLIKPIVNRIIADDVTHAHDKWEQIIRYAVQRTIDLVQIGQFYYYCYVTENVIYCSIPQHNRYKSIIEELHIEDNESITHFFDKVSVNNAYEQTDLLAINKSLPDFDGLIRKLRKIFLADATSK